MRIMQLHSPSALSGEHKLKFAILFVLFLLFINLKQTMDLGERAVRNRLEADVCDTRNAISALGMRSQGAQGLAMEVAQVCLCFVFVQQENHPIQHTPQTEIF